MKYKLHQLFHTILTHSLTLRSGCYLLRKKGREFFETKDEDEGGERGKKMQSGNQEIQTTTTTKNGWEGSVRAESKVSN